MIWAKNFNVFITEWYLEWHKHNRHWCTRQPTKVISPKNLISTLHQARGFNKIFLLDFLINDQLFYRKLYICRNKEKYKKTRGMKLMSQVSPPIKSFSFFETNVTWGEVTPTWTEGLHLKRCNKNKSCMWQPIKRLSQSLEKKLSVYTF